MPGNPSSNFIGTFVRVQLEKTDKTRRRVRIPDEVLGAVGWTDVKGPKEIVGEVRGSGHIRLHRKSAIEEERAGLVASLAEKAADDGKALEQLAVHHSRFIEIPYYAGDKRLRLPNDALLVLTRGEETLERCYVQAINGAVDLLSLKAFFARQATHEAVVGIELSA